MGNVCKPKGFDKKNTVTSDQKPKPGAPKPDTCLLPGKRPKKKPPAGPVEHVEVPVEIPEELANPFEIRALVVYVDYGFEPAKSGGWCPPAFGDKLDTKENADMIIELLQAAGVTDITLLSNLNATKYNVLQAIYEVGARCDDNDLFFFFYSGHGAEAQDWDGDEDDGKDEAMCTPSEYGTCDETTWLTDDEFSEAAAAVIAGQKLFVIDCCHSGTLLDFDKPHWAGQAAVGICGCKDSQEGAAMGGAFEGGFHGLGDRGGAFTKSIYSAVKSHANEYVDCATIYNYCLEYAPHFVPPGHQQEIQLTSPPGFEPYWMPWPIVVPA